jgi:hypothetical protein
MGTTASLYGGWHDIAGAIAKVTTVTVLAPAVHSAGQTLDSKKAVK